jgi:hypothetical protein
VLLKNKKPRRKTKRNKKSFFQKKPKALRQRTVKGEVFAS